MGMDLPPGVRTGSSARMRLQAEAEQMAQRERAAMLAVGHRRVLMRKRRIGSNAFRGQWMRHHEARDPHCHERRPCSAERSPRHVSAHGRWFPSQPSYAALQEVDALERGEWLERDRAPRTKRTHVTRRAARYCPRGEREDRRGEHEWLAP